MCTVGYGISEWNHLKIIVHLVSYGIAVVKFLSSGQSCSYCWKLLFQIDGVFYSLECLVRSATGLFITSLVVRISSVFEVQQYREIAARSSGYFIIADHGSVYREIPDEYTDLGDED